jgi:predicted metalloprotease with PDZ domain
VWRRWLCAVSLAVVVASAAFHAAEPVRYRFSFPHPEHHWMQVEATFADLGVEPLELRISRSSPGRYSLHDFVKNVYDVHAYAEDGVELPLERPDAYGWRVTAHARRVSVQYKVYGDRIDGTYLAVDTAHAHINMPAAVMWARGLDDRPITLTVDAPSGGAWQVATQLHPGAAANEFTAPNLQYLIDSPIEFGPVMVESFVVGPRTFRFAAHHTGTRAELRSLVKDVSRIVEQEGAIYGEFPPYEPGSYTFLADYLPTANGDGMEHRNSTVMTSVGSIAGSRMDLLDTVAHEFFHSWNVERIRPRDLEPFDLERTNTSDELWLAEGFTQYYGPLVLTRAGLIDLHSEAQQLTALVEAVADGSGRLFRSAVDMSRMAPLTDGGRPIDRTNWSISVTSYYQIGGAIALALDLALRDRSHDGAGLDDFMREMWRRYGKPGGSREGYVDAPYTMDDAESALAAVSGDGAFARDFFARYIRGREVPDFATLLAPAGLILHPLARGRAWLGDMQLSATGTGAAVVELVAPTWPIYAAGLDEDDEIRRLDGARIASMEDVGAVLRRHKPGDRLQVVYAGRDHATRTASVTLGEDPRMEVLPTESSGGTLTAAQRAFRERWLGPK